MSTTLLLDTLVWGFLATVSMTTILAAAQGLHYTRMNLPVVLGTIISGDLDHAIRIGYVLHFVIGWAQAYVYVLIFWAASSATWYGGAALGVLHALFLLAVVLPYVPSVHPRMASENRQPQPTALLEPPGFFGLYYGTGTPLATLAAHAAYGAVLGAGIAIG